MEKSLPALKAKVNLIPRVLGIIAVNQGSYVKIEQAISDFWRSESKRRKPPTSRNSMRAVFGPTLRHLQLIRGERDSIRLLPLGKKLLAEYKEREEAGYKKLLARHLVKLDKEKWLNVLGYLSESGRSHMFDDLLNAVRSQTPEGVINEERLTKFLLYCQYVGVVSVKNRSVVLRNSQYERCTRNSCTPLSDQDFVRLLFEAYELVRSTSEGSPYVSIPDVRDVVCERGGIWLDDFDQKLRDIPKETKDYLIQLTQPMVRKSDGLTIGGKYLYYIAIYEKRRD